MTPTSRTPLAEGTVPIGGDCQICGRPLGPRSRRYHAACHRARPAARYSKPAARRRARALITADIRGLR